MTMERWRPGGRGILPWRPFRDLDEIQRRFEDFWPARFSAARFPFESTEWVPAIDMYEKDDTYVVKAELPGMKEEDVDVQIIGDRIAIKGEKRSEEEIKEENYFRSERSYGSFLRSIDLPPDANRDKIEATYEDGVLEVSIPKKAAVKPKKISVAGRKTAGSTATKKRSSTAKSAGKTK